MVIKCIKQCVNIIIEKCVHAVAFKDTNVAFKDSYLLQIESKDKSEYYYSSNHHLIKRFHFRLP